MKRLVLIVLFVVVVANLYANIEDKEKTTTLSEPAKTTLSLNGKVVDKQTGEVLTGACVQIEGTELFTYTDFDGSFTFSNLKPGNYTAVVTFISYEKSKVQIETTTQKAIKVELETARIK